MYDAFAAAQNEGVHTAVFGANCAYWRVRTDEFGGDGSASDRLLTCYKSADADPVKDPSARTVRFRQAGRPEQALLGVMYDTFGGTDPASHGEIVHTATDTWPYAGTGATEGQRGPTIIGYEVDRYFSHAGPQLPGQVLLAASPFRSVYGHDVLQHTSIHAPNGRSWAFASGTMAWSWGLDRDGLTSSVVQGMTRNILNEFLAPRNLPTRTTPFDVGRPDIVIEQPTDNDLLSPGPFACRGRVGDDESPVTAVHVEVRNTSTGRHLNADGTLGNRQLLSADLTVGPGTWAFPVPDLPAGSYEVRATAVDAQGNRFADVVRFRVGSDSEAPTIQVATPSPGSRIGQPTMVIEGTAADTTSPVTRVDLLVRSLDSGHYADARGLLGPGWQLIEVEIPEPSSSVSWRAEITTPPPGSYYVAARASDAAGNTIPWIPIRFEVA
jgi:hypothetical protein